jgi:glycerol-3-phosphate dehydrogenase (NAD(P)+)
MAQLQVDRENARFLPHQSFPSALHVNADLADVVGAAAHLLVVTPSHALRAVLTSLAPLIRPGQGVAYACKGFEPGTGKLAHVVVAETLGEAVPIAVMSGPTFARELAMGLPTAMTIAANQPAFADRLAALFHGDGFRAYTATDLTGVELGGAVKNVMAIAVGIADGFALGANTRAALITRGLAEMMRLGEAMGARPETLTGLSGMGDLVLTCTDDQSRNRRLGLLLAQGRDVAAATAEIEQVVEGIKAAPEVMRLAQQHAVDMPISDAVHRILRGELAPIDGVRQLAMRPARPEIGD